MHFTCKQCFKKFKGKKIEDVQCDNPTCTLKYNMCCDEINFTDYKLDESEILSSFQTEDPPSMSEMTEADWIEWCEANWPGSTTNSTPPF